MSAPDATSGMFNGSAATAGESLLTELEAIEATVNTDIAAALASADAAATSAAASAASAASVLPAITAQATAAATSATASATSATASATSATASATSATAAAGSATSAASSASTAVTNASSATTSAGNAATSATAAAGSATTASTQATNAATSATNASTSATNAAASAATATTIGQTTTGRNYLHNPMFRVQQRGTGAFTTNNAFTADRWQLSLSLDTVSVTVASLADADRTAIGDEAFEYALQNVFTGNAGAGALNVLLQKIENVRRLANKTVTVSFWAKAASGTPKVGVSLDQSFGTGGSPSSTVNGAGTAVTLSTTWTRYSVTLGLASLSGKTLGSNNDHSTILFLWYSAGTTNATRAGSIGVQAATISVAGVQLEFASAATPIERLDPRNDLANCQRFYFVSGQFAVGGFSTTTTTFYSAVPFPVTMRVTPTATPTWGTLTNASTNAVSPTTSGAVLSAATTASGSMVAIMTSCTFSADL